MRTSLGLSKIDLSKYLGISRQFYHDCEVGKKKLSQVHYEKLLKRFMSSDLDNLQLTGMIDFLRLRFKTINYLEVIKRVLQLDPKGFVHEEKGGYSYKSKLTYGSLKIYYSTDIKMGCMIDLSGTACRELEHILETQGRDWQQFFDDIFAYEAEQIETYGLRDDFLNVTRLDLALDELFNPSGNFNLRVLLQKVWDNDLVCKLQRFKPDEEHKMIKGFFVSQGLSLNFGTRSGSVQFTFYEKDLEQVNKTKRDIDEIHETDKFKNRYEVRLTDEKATQTIRDIFSNGENLVEKAVRIINSYITVYDDRVKGTLCDSWYTLLGNSKKQKFITKPREFTLERKLNWTETTVTPSYLTVGLLSKIKKRDYLAEFQEKAKVSDRDIKLIEREFEIAKLDQALSQNDIREIELDIEFLKERLSSEKGYDTIS